jgi:hypothetical protein
MMSRYQRWGPVSGLLLCATWMPMAIAIPRLPDLGSAQQVQAFWRDNQDLMQWVVVCASIGFLFLLLFLGALIELLRSLSGAGAMTWTAFASALMFMTALNVALGLATAGGLLVESDPASTYALHTAGFLLAAPAAFAGAAFFVAIAVITWQTRALPRLSGWLAIVGIVGNTGAVFGTLSLTGPLNSGNGIVGGIAAPLGLYLAWIFAISVWWLRRGNTIERSAPNGTLTDPYGAR